jgi:hypothetical protein
MRRAILIAVVALLVGLPQKATATGPKFIHDVCLEAKPISESICIGYISGVADAEDNTGKFCLPPNISNDDLVSVVRNYMRQKPAAAGFLASHNYNASVLVGMALKEKFPCN